MRKDVESFRPVRVMWTFCVRSLFREYGWLFVWRIAIRRPVHTLRALRDTGSLEVVGDGAIEIGDCTAAVRGDAPPSIVGAGFCLKPVDPPCPSDRANHDCVFLEEFMSQDAARVPVPCRSCAIRDLGTQSLRAGSAFYVMTSARDILEDVYVPALDARRFPTGLFVLCRYSFKPFALGLRAAGMSARLVPLGRGDCRDYRTWLLADRGIKVEQTTVDLAGIAGVRWLRDAAAAAQASRFERRGNVLFPVPAGPVA